jgi:hypothetical protein
MKTKIAKKNKDIGFVLLKMDNNSSVIDTALSICANRPYDQISLFSSSVNNWSDGRLPIFHINEVKYFFGSLFIFDLASLILTRDCPNLINRYFYATNIPWTDRPETSYSDWKDIFYQPNLEIIAPNKTISDVYEICWKKPLAIIPELNYESLSEII